MAYWTGRITLSSTGDNALTGVGFQPTWIRVRVSQKYCVTDNFIHLCLGSATASSKNYSAIYGDTTGMVSKEGNDKLISHWEKISGTWTEVLSAVLKSFDANGFTITTVAGNANYKVAVECGN